MPGLTQEGYSLQKSSGEGRLAGKFGAKLDLLVL